MRLSGLILVLLLAASTYSCSRSMGATTAINAIGSSAIETEATAATAANKKTKVDFETQIEPILKAKCQSCHFKGGKVYDKLPFDRPETIRTLGTKLFTRIQDENERRLIRDFLAQP
jgi:hypothetical protein